MIYVIMGVCCCGKSLIGKMLADELDMGFYDGDDFHSQSSVKKMSCGEPLDDNDRKPWLDILSEEMKEWEKNGGAVLACSALKKKYRDILCRGNEVKYIYLKGTQELIKQRMHNREDHFMPLDLIQSQFKALEEPTDAIVVGIDQKPEKVLEDILRQIN